MIVYFIRSENSSIKKKKSGNGGRAPPAPFPGAGRGNQCAHQEKDTSVHIPHWDDQRNQQAENQDAQNSAHNSEDQLEFWKRTRIRMAFNKQVPGLLHRSVHSCGKDWPCRARLDKQFTSSASPNRAFRTQREEETRPDRKEADGRGLFLGFAGSRSSSGPHLPLSLCASPTLSPLLRDSAGVKFVPNREARKPLGFVPQ